jgi:hypothetical protein
MSSHVSFRTQALVLPLLGLAVVLGSSPVESKGCLKGAAVGAVAGHVAGHHAVVGAAAGCVVGHHLAKKKLREQRRQQQHSKSAGDSRAALE